jgi:hypothetical protein
LVRRKTIYSAPNQRLEINNSTIKIKLSISNSPRILIPIAPQRLRWCSMATNSQDCSQSHLGRQPTPGNRPPQDPQHLDTTQSIQEITQLIEACEENERDQANKKRLNEVKTLLLTTLTKLHTQNQGQYAAIERLEAKVDSLTAAIKKPALTGASTRNYAQILASPATLSPETLLPTPINPIRTSPKETTAILRPSLDSDIYKNKKATSKEIVKAFTENLRVPLAAAHTLPSGDIKVFFFKREDKAKALGLPGSTLSKIKARFLQEDYPIEILAVPTSLQIKHGKEADNQELLQQIQKENRQWNPTIQGTRIARIYRERSLIPKPGHQEVKSTSAILYLKNQESQIAAILNGLVIEGRKYATQIYDQGLQIPQCFKCQGWGHTQSTCHREVSCGRCAGRHNTRECQEDSSKAKCTNCGKKHHAWNRKECEVYKEKSQQRTSLRASLLQRAWSWAREDSLREGNFQQHFPALPQQTQTVRRSISASQQGLERPTKIRTLDRRERGQSRLSFDSTQPAFEGIPATQDLMNVCTDLENER